MSLLAAGRLGWRVVVDATGLTLERLDVVTLIHRHELDTQGRKIGRLGLGDGRRMYVLGIAPDPAQGTVTLDLWG